jgi:ATP-binding cassette subfamily C (CFTR/MRP) protein 10
LITSDAQKQTGTFYLSIYVSIAAFNSLFTLLRAFLFAFGCILAARRLHHRLLGRIMLASISWWDRTPCGRVTNRLSSDVAIVDDSLPFQLNIFLASLFSLIGNHHFYYFYSFNAPILKALYWSHLWHFLC